MRIGGVIVPLPGWIKATVGLALPVMANVAELVRGAVRSIPSGQWEAAEALAFTRLQTLRLVILPQCVKRMMPPWMNLYAIVVVATPLTSIVGVSEAMTLDRRHPVLGGPHRSSGADVSLSAHLVLPLLLPDRPRDGRGRAALSRCADGVVRPPIRQPLDPHARRRQEVRRARRSSTASRST